MKGDFSRLTGDPRKHYNGVLMQQGRVQVDADWNEQQTINQYRGQAVTNDVIGQGTAPIVGGGFQIEAVPVGTTLSDLSISPGHIYVDGILCELEATSVQVTSVTGSAKGLNTITVSAMSVDGRGFQPGQWVEITWTQRGRVQPDIVRILHPNTVQILSVDTTAQTLTVQAYIDPTTQQVISVRRIPSYLTQADYPQPAYSSAPSESAQLPALALPQNSPALVYLDVWLRHVTWLDDQDIREVALNGADTTTRMQVVQQVKILPLAPSQDMTCTTQFPAWDSLVAPSTGTLNAQTVSISTTVDACSPPSSSGYQGLDNQLYRVEIHDVAQTPIQYKWSRDNGSVVIGIKAFNGSDIIVNEVGLDDMLGFAPVDGQTIWGEIVDDVTDLQGLPGQLIKIQSVSPNSKTITMVSPPVQVDPKRHPRLRRWDSFGTITINENGTTDWLDLESGIQIQFWQGTNKNGDYWLIPARTTGAQIEWPQDIPGLLGHPLPQIPLGITHAYCRLALLVPPPLKSEFWTVLDCRQSFTSLASLTSQAPPAILPALHITAINWNNDDFVTSDQLLKNGLQLTLDNTISSISQAAMTVTLEVPSSPVGFSATTDLIINGSVQVALNAQNMISWTWASMDSKTLVTSLTNIIKTFQSKNIHRAPYMRVKVLGYAVYKQLGNLYLHLDGQAFGQENIRQEMNTPSTALTFPSGSGIAASDFESWFSLVPTPLWITKIAFKDTNGFQLGSTVMPPYPSQPITFGGKEGIQVIEITFSRQVLLQFSPQTGANEGQFTIISQGSVTWNGAITQQPPNPDGSQVVSFLLQSYTKKVLEGIGVVRLVTTPISSFPSGVYQLTISGATNPPVITYIDSTPLDGDFDFLPGEDFTLDFTVEPPPT